MNALFMKTLLHMLVILKYLPLLIKDERQKWIEYCFTDFANCANCFDGNCCQSYLDNISIQYSFEAESNLIFGGRKTQRGLCNKQKIILKYLVNDENLDNLKRQLCYGINNCEEIWNNKSNKDILRTKLLYVFKTKDNITGFQICPTDSVTRFMEVFSTRNTYAYALLNFNVEPLVANTLWKNNFSVPKLYSSCGFVTIQSDNGRPLYEFYDKSLDVRLLIAKNLLQAAIQFSFGIANFRIYLTDATPDNIVVDDETLAVTFVDLDSVFIVDSEPLTKNQRIHRHEKIECEGHCFAYVPQDLCSYYLSDINLFAICQLLNEDFGTGLLYHIPDTISQRYPALKLLLNSCVYCRQSECENRFEIARELIDVFSVILDNK